MHPSIYEDMGQEKADVAIDKMMAFHTKVNEEDMWICEEVSGSAS